MRFVYAIAEGDAAAAWQLMDSTFQLAYTQAWAYEHDVDHDTAARICQAGALDPLWPDVATAIIDGLQATIDNFVEVTSAGRLGLYSEVVPVGPDLEQV